MYKTCNLRFYYVDKKNTRIVIKYNTKIFFGSALEKVITIFFITVCAHWPCNGYR